ncbi:MAG: BNR repeat-containing protein, partial [Armatimonadota bacterium]
MRDKTCLIILLTLFLTLMMTTELFGREESFLKSRRILPVDEVWTGSSPRFAILTHSGHQYVGYYDANRQMTIAARSLDSDQWQMKKLYDFTGWDSHNFISMALDSEGNLHVSGNMHCAPLRYYRTAKPGDISTLEAVHKMVGRQEDRATYPQFFKDAAGQLYFTYRDGGSGNGVNFVNRYDAEKREWRRCGDTPFVDGKGQMSAYHFYPVLGPDRNFHIAWCWRDTPDVATNHDVSYARGVGGLDRWEKGDGTPIQLPLTVHNTDIIDSVGTNSGLMNNVQLSLDSQNRPMVSYIKYDPRGRTQLYVMRLENGQWKRYQTTNWDSRWEFEGLGSIGAKIWFTGPTPWHSEGILAQTFVNLFLEPYAQIRFLDEKTLQPVCEPVRLYPSDLDNITLNDKDTWQVNWVGLDFDELER